MRRWSPGTWLREKQYFPTTLMQGTRKVRSKKKCAQRGSLFQIGKATFPLRPLRTLCQPPPANRAAHGFQRCHSPARGLGRSKRTQHWGCSVPSSGPEDLQQSCPTPCSTTLLQERQLQQLEGIKDYKYQLRSVELKKETLKKKLSHTPHTASA